MAPGQHDRAGGVDRQEDAESRAPNEARRTVPFNSPHIQRDESLTPKRGDGFSSSMGPYAPTAVSDSPKRQ
jgi:hypothetical protein